MFLEQIYLEMKLSNFLKKSVIIIRLKSSTTWTQVKIYPHITKENLLICVEGPMFQQPGILSILNFCQHRVLIGEGMKTIKCFNESTVQHFSLKKSSINI